MGVKRGNLKLISELLLPSFVPNYMLIKVKKEGLNKKKKRTERERRRIDRERRTKRKNTRLWEILA